MQLIHMYNTGMM